MPKPEHIAFIMDGNGRWATGRGLPRTAGHRAGVETLRKTVRAVGDLGIKWMTVYAFSSENWTRPPTEVSDLMGLLKLFIRRDLAELHQNGVRVRVIGERKALKPDIRLLLEEAEALTADNVSMTLVIAFNYGARDEIARAAAKIARMAAAGEISSGQVTAETFGAFLDTAGMPDPDLIVRTGGDQRLSNFLLWQAAYAELCFLDCFWPDFGGGQPAHAVSAFEVRDRRLGGIPAGDVAW